MTPEDRRYVKTHEWVKIEGDLAVVGITDHAQEALGDITFVELPEDGQKLQAKHECGVIESVKAASDIYAPISGEVAQVNQTLNNRPETINEDPFGRGWIIKIRGFNRAEYDALLDAAEYDGLIDEDE